MKIPPMEDAITIGDASRILGLSAERIRQLTRDGRLSFVQSPYGMMFERTAIEYQARTREYRRRERG
jgi:hypothetical protein